MTERRRYVRIPLDAKVRLVVADEVHETTLIDVSLGGALVERPSMWLEEVGAQREVEIEILLAGEVERIVMRARVAHVGAHVVGFESCQVDAVSATHLRRLLTFRLGDMSLVEREFTALLDARSV